MRLRNKVLMFTMMLLSVVAYGQTAISWTPSTGGGSGSPTFPVNAQTASYSVVAADFAACKLITMNNAAATTVTLLAAAPISGQCVQVEDIGAGAVTVAPNGRTIDGSVSSITVNQNQGVTIVSDGTNYTTQRGIGGAAAVSSVFGRTGAVVAAANDYTWAQLAAGTATSLATFPGGDFFLTAPNAQVGASYTMVAADENKLLTFNNAGAVAVTLPQANTAGFTTGAVFHLKNLGAGTVTVTPTTSQIDAAATLALTTGQGADIYSDGTNYFTQKGSGGGGGVAISGTPAANQIAQWTNATTVKGIDFPDVKYFNFAICVNAVAGLSISTTGATPQALCRAGTNNKDALVTWGASDVGYIKVHLPKDWDTGVAPSLSIDLASTDATAGHTIIMQASTACAKGDGSTTDDVAFNAAQSFSTITLVATANQTWNATLASITTTGCAAPSTLFIKISRTTDTATNVEVYGAEITIPRLLAVQAN